MKWNQFKLWEVILFVVAALIIGGIAGAIIGVEFYAHTACVYYSAWPFFTRPIFVCAPPY